jgi:hypothetical protein
MKQPMIELPKPDLKRLARDFLHCRGVAYNDLITGDHAADLLVNWAKAMTTWEEKIEQQRLEAALISLYPSPPFLMNQPVVFIQNGRELKQGVDYFIVGNEITFTPKKESR